MQDRPTRNADYIRQQQVRKPGVATIKIRVVKGYMPIWDKPHLPGMKAKN